MVLFQYGFITNALLAMLLVSVISGVAGTLVVVRRRVFMAGGVTHASFGGIGLAYYWESDTLLGAFFFALLASLGIEALVRRGWVRSDSAAAMMWSGGMAVGVVFMSLTPGYAANLTGFMFGDILSVTRFDLWCMCGMAVLLLAGAALFYRPLLYYCFSPRFARIARPGADVIGLACTVAEALSVVLAIKAVGIILVLAVFTIPQTVAGHFARSLWAVMALSGGVALAGCVGGLAAAWCFDLPAGAATTLLLLVALLLVKCIRRS